MKKALLSFSICILILVSCFLQAQQNKIDSLQNVLKTAKEDTSMVKTLNLICKQYMVNGNYKLAIEYAQRAEQHSKNINYKKGMAASYNNMGSTYLYIGDYENALANHQKSLKIRIETDDKKGEAASYNNIGNIYFSQGLYEKALECHLKNLKISEDINDKQLMAAAHNNIGGIYNILGNYNVALDQLSKSLKISEEIGDKKGMSNSNVGLGNVFEELGNYEKALESHLKGLKVNLEMGDKQGISMCYNNMGNIYEKQGKYAKALEYQLKGLEINEQIGGKQGIATSYNNVGNIYAKQNKLKEAFYYLNQSLIITKEIGSKDGIKDAYGSLSELYNREADYKQAYTYHKLYSDIKDTLLNEQSSKQIAEMNTKYDSEKKDKELIKKDAEISKQQAETEKQNLQRNAFIIGFALVLVLAFFIFRGYRQKQNANKLLEEKNILIENQKQLVEEKNLKITDSINYAKRIQQAILPSQELIKTCFPESFIFFRPKDIVSGDFYWFSEKGDKFIFAIADCTGHGVPGAFMSMIGNTLLNEIVNVKNIFEPAKILNELNKGIVHLLNQSCNDSTTQDDGMDITIIAIDKTIQEIEFAGANHFSYLFNNSQFKTLNGDVFSIGGMFGRADINFTSQKIKIEKGSTIYLFTDGFVDQFGGEENKKFLSGRFETLLQTLQQKNMEHQIESLITAFDNWKAHNKQLDDVLVMGIKI